MNELDAWLLMGFLNPFIDIVIALSPLPLNINWNASVINTCREDLSTLKVTTLFVYDDDTVTDRELGIDT